MPLTCAAENDATVRLRFTKSDVRDVLNFYQRLTDKPVFAALDVQAIVWVETEEDLGLTAAIELIRTTLLERYGIELRATDRGETLVAWSKNPKYPRRTELPLTDAERGALPKRHIRIIKPEATK